MEILNCNYRKSTDLNSFGGGRALESQYSRAGVYAICLELIRERLPCQLPKSSRPAPLQDTPRLSKAPTKPSDGPASPWNIPFLAVPHPLTEARWAEVPERPCHFSLPALRHTPSATAAPNGPHNSNSSTSARNPEKGSARPVKGRGPY